MRTVRIVLENDKCTVSRTLRATKIFPSKMSWFNLVMGVHFLVGQSGSIH